MLTIPLIGTTDSHQISHELKVKGLKTEISHYQWERSEDTIHDIHATLYLGHDNHSLYLYFEVKEPLLRATYNEHFSNVFEDSCVEFFFRESDTPNYTNIEINPHGAALVGYGEDRNNRIHPSIEYIHSLGITTTFSEELPYNGFWSVLYHIPMRNIEKDKVMYANAYKCGDLTTVPHFITLFYIDTQSPDFHQSSYFQPFNFE